MSTITIFDLDGQEQKIAHLKITQQQAVIGGCYADNDDLLSNCMKILKFQQELE